MLLDGGEAHRVMSGEVGHGVIPRHRSHHDGAPGGVGQGPEEAVGVSVLLDETIHLGATIHDSDATTHLIYNHPVVG